MKTLIAIAFVILAAVINSAAQAPVYRFDAAKVRVGTVYHYVKSNVDGTRLENVSMYIVSRDRIESFKYHDKGTRAGLVAAEMDWKHFMAKKLESWQVFSKDERRLFATLTFDQPARSASIVITSGGQDPEVHKMGTFPVHVYNFDLASLNVAWRHLANPEKAFRVGIADPTFKSNPFFKYNGELSIAYERDEPRNGVETRRYRAEGAGIGGRGTIWVNKREGHIEDMEFEVPNNPEWKTFKLKLIRTDQLTPEKWEQFIASRF